MFWVYRYKGFSFTAARTVHTALVLAGQQGCSQADTGHLLLALVQTAQGTAADFLRRKRVTSTALAEHTAAHAAGRPRRLHSRDLAPELSKAMEFAVLGAHAASAARAENEHLLCAILEDSSCTASRWLAALGIELPQAARECRQLSGQLVLPAQPRMAASRTGRPSDKYGRDLTRLAQEGRLDPVLCRDAELDRMIEILCRRQKNNPCLLGEPGVGKSALAEALAQRIAAGQITPALRGKRVLALDMASMVAGTKYRGDFEERFKNLLEELYRDRSTILFIDEIHRLNRQVEEILYPALEDHAIDIIMGKGPSARSLRVDLNPFTLVGATTRAGQLSSPLRDRFGVILRLELYTTEQLTDIVRRSAMLLKIPCSIDGAMEIASRARGTPRIANRLLKRVRDFADVMGNGEITQEIAHMALDRLEIDELGLDSNDRRMLEMIIKGYSGGPVGLETLASALGEETVTLEDVCEPYLMQLGFLARTPRGRCATALAYQHLGYQQPDAGGMDGQMTLSAE